MGLNNPIPRSLKSESKYVKSLPSNAPHIATAKLRPTEGPNTSRKRTTGPGFVLYVPLMAPEYLSGLVCGHIEPKTPAPFCSATCPQKPLKY